MLSDLLILTNNPDVRDKYIDADPVFKDVSLLEIFAAARDLIHKGHRLLSHPLSGSVKPGETCYKSILLSRKPEAGTDPFSIELIEDAMNEARFHIEGMDRLGKTPRWEIAKDSKLGSDLRLIDLTLIDSVLMYMQ